MDAARVALAAVVAELRAAPHAPLRLRRMLHTDLPAVLAIQAASYPAVLHEEAATMAMRITVYPDGQFVAEAEAAAADGGAPSAGGRVVAYAQSHPWRAGAPPPELDDAGLADCIAATVAGPRSLAYYHLHDVACALPGRGVGRKLFAAAAGHGASCGYATAGLVAVLGMQTLWAQCGFVARRELTGPDSACYAVNGVNAVWMDAELPLAVRSGVVDR